MKKVIINTDGASRGNPGKAAAGFVIRSEEGVVLAQEGVYLGRATNNEAEYRAVILSLQKLLQVFSRELLPEVEICSDSQLIVEQLRGRFKVKQPHLVSFYQTVRKLEDSIGPITYSYIPREMNSLADRIANDTLDGLS